MDRHIVLVGAMGAGKTSVGELVARRLRRRFVDSDAQIEVAHGTTGRELAAARGIALLHAAEADALLAALERPQPSVVAAAASVADRRDVLGRLAVEEVFVVLLDADVAVLAARAATGAHRRSFDWAAMESTVIERTERLRRIADLVLDVSEHDAEAVAELVVAALVPPR
jgi:shikimate kinase